MLEREVIAAIAKVKKMSAGDITPTSTLREDLNIDSLDALEVLFEIEDANEIDLPSLQQSELANIKTVQELTSWLHERMT